nr:NusG domain II-containing protein [Oceanococcus sp. HetDA_MAG_MS8]
MLRPTDIVIIACALGLQGHFMARYWTPNVAGSRVRIQTPTQTQEWPLDEPRELQVEGALGVSRLRIESGGIRFLDSPCKGKVCVRSGHLDHGGETTACVPNRISVQVLPAARSDAAVDALHY